MSLQQLAVVRRARLGRWLWAGVTSVALVSVLGLPAKAQTVLPVETRETQISVNDWLARVHLATSQRAYAGTFVVWAGGTISSARIWHVCDGDQQMERVDALTGPPRSTFRRNEQVLTFFPQRRLVISEKRESLGLFPSRLLALDSSIAQFYRVIAVGVERVAGVEADIVELRPQDGLRFGYRVWTEKKSGLVLKLQTLDAQGRVLEQSAFSELQLDAPVSMGKLAQMMDNTEGYQILRPEMEKTTAAAEGWVLKAAVPGFKPMSCFKRSVGNPAQGPSDNTLQWIFSDGLASVSLFVEVFDAKRHVQPGSLAVGATYTLTRRSGDWWLTLVGEVPLPTLMVFAQALERKK